MSRTRSSRLARAVGRRSAEAPVIPAQPGASVSEVDAAESVDDGEATPDEDAGQGVEPATAVQARPEETLASQNTSEPQEPQTGDDEQAMGGRHLTNPSDPYLAGDPAQPGLDDDPTTSPVGSLSLHMLSEHGVTGFLHLDDDELMVRHLQLHSYSDTHDHEITDHRFRPVRALNAALLLSDEPTPTIPSP